MFCEAFVLFRFIHLAVSAVLEDVSINRLKARWAQEGGKAEQKKPLALMPRGLWVAQLIATLLCKGGAAASARGARAFKA